MLLSTFFTLALPLLTAAAPLEARHDSLFTSLIRRFDLCRLPIISAFTCDSGAEVQLVATPLGLARGIQTTPGAVRFSVKYATATRFGPPHIATSWALP